MGGETEKEVSGWTVDTLKSHFDNRLHAIEANFAHRLDALEEMMATRLAAADKAVDKAEGQMNARLAGMNEFRDQLKDQASKFVTVERIDEYKEAVEARLKTIDVAVHECVTAERIDELRGVTDARLKVLEHQIANWQGRLLVLGSAWSVVVIVLTALINYFIRTIR